MLSIYSILLVTMSSSAALSSTFQKKFLSIDFRSFLIPNVYLDMDMNPLENSDYICKYKNEDEFTIYNNNTDKYIHAMISFRHITNGVKNMCVAYNKSKNKYDIFEVACIIRHIQKTVGMDMNTALTDLNTLMLDLLCDNATTTTCQTDLEDDDIQKDNKLMYDDMDKYVLQPLTFPSDRQFAASRNVCTTHVPSTPAPSRNTNIRACSSQKLLHFNAKNRLKFKKDFEDAIQEEHKTNTIDNHRRAMYVVDNKLRELNR
jgi:hypothetical protein